MSNNVPAEIRQNGTTKSTNTQNVKYENNKIYAHIIITKMDISPQRRGGDTCVKIVKITERRFDFEKS